jgi:uncharacterized protein (TIGR02996 family)
MPTADEPAFLAAILANPDADTPRLAFADWLDERGTDDDRARAALIRAQCRAEVLPEGSAARKKLEREANALVRAHGKRWAAPLTALGLTDGHTFRRGFLDSVTMSATTFATSAKKLFDAVPTVRAAHFVHAANELNDLTKCKYLSRLASVDVSEMCWCGACPIHRDLDALFKCDKLTSLTSLSVHSDRMDAAGARKLAASAALAKLKELDVSYNPLGAAGVTAMLKSKHLGNLTELKLGSCELGDAGLKVLAKAKSLPALRKLVLAGNELTADGVTALIASPLFAQLRHLDLWRNPIGHVGARALAAAGSALEFLDVRACGITEAAKKVLVKRFGKKVAVS